MNAPKIWVPRCTIIEPRSEIIIAPRVAGRFKLEVFRPDGRRRQLVDWFPNLITNAGLNAIGTLTSWLSACRVGTGSTTPNVSDTALVSFVAGTSTRQATASAAASTPPYHGSFTVTYRFAAGVAAGNLAEVGIATQAAVGGTLFSRALILDGDGDPTTITVLSDEVLDVTYQLQYLPPTSDANSTITVGGIDYDLVTRAANITTFTSWGGDQQIGGAVQPFAHNGALGAITTTPSGTQAAGTATNASYGNNNLYRDCTLSWALGEANFGNNGVRAVSFKLGTANQALGHMQFSIANDDSPNAGIPKTSSQVMSFVVRHTWARGTPV